MMYNTADKPWTVYTTLDQGEMMHNIAESLGQWAPEQDVIQHTMQAQDVQITPDQPLKVHTIQDKNSMVHTMSDHHRTLLIISD